MQYSSVILDLLSQVEVLETGQVLWYAGALDEYGNGEKTIEKAFHALLRSRQLYLDETEVYVSASPIREITREQRMAMELFWVLLDAMPYSRNFILSFQKTFQLSYINKHQQLVQVAYVPRHMETAVCRFVREIPKNEYEQECDCRIALLEDPKGEERMKKVGFYYLVTIRQDAPPENRLEILDVVDVAHAWEDL